MKKLVAVSLAALCLSGSVQAHGFKNDKNDRSESASPFTFPVSVTSVNQGSFTGTLRIERFAVNQGTLVARGSLVGTLTDVNGGATAIYRNVTLPVNLPTRSQTKQAQQAQLALVCDVLHLELGPLNLDLLGLVVNLNQVILDIDAVAAAGNLVGNLLCAIVGLLDGGNLGLLANLLNQLLGLLG